MHVLLFFFYGLSLVQSQCVSGLLAGFAMDEIGGPVIRDSTVLKQTIKLNSNFSFSTIGNPQGVSSLVLSGEGQLVLQPFSRPSQFTFSTWFKTTDQGENAIFSWTDASSSYFVFARIIMGRVGVVLETLNPNPTPTLTTGTYNDGRWHFLVVTFDLNMFTIYVDPHLPTVEVLQISGTARQYSVLQIGGLSGRGEIAYTGELDDFRVFNLVLPLSDMQRIALQLDSPCSATLLVPGRSAYVIPNHTSTVLSFDSTQNSVCGVKDGFGRCTNNRYGIALTACAGSIEGLSATMVVGGVVIQPPKDIRTSITTCAAGYTGQVGTDAVQLCMSASRINSFFSNTNPISTNSLNYVRFTSGSATLNLAVSLMVGDGRNFNLPLLAFAPQTNIVQSCSANYMEARWATPILSNGLTCNNCVYQAWYSPLSKVVNERVNLLTVCGVKLYGIPLPDTFTLPFYNQFVLPPIVPIPGDAYVWSIIATSTTDGVEGVVGVMDTCPMQTPSLAPTSAPTGTGGVGTEVMNSNVLVLHMIPENFPPPRTGFITQFTSAVARVLGTDVQRISYTNFTDKGGNKVANGFDILPPVYGGYDNRTAGTLALLLYTLHRNQSSVLYRILPNADPEPAGFSSNYGAVPVWTAEPTDVDTFPLRTVIIIVSVLLAVICCCCLIYLCYRFTKGKDEKPPKKKRIEHTTVVNNNNCARPQRFYNEDEKHNSDHINFPARTTPTRGSDLASTRRYATSPDTRSDPVSYKGATMNSASDSPHMDPRDWKSVIALHGRNGTVDQGDLVFKIGDVIRVVGGCDGPHWFLGELESTGARGMVPVNHVKGHIPLTEVRRTQSRVM